MGDYMSDDNKYEMPVGFSLSLSSNPIALDYFSTLDIETKLNIKHYIQDNNNEYDALRRTNQVISCLNNNNIDFLSQ